MLAPYGVDVKMSVAVLAKKGYERAEEVASELISHFSRLGLNVYAVAPLKSRYAMEVSSIADLKGLEPKILVTVGGDGTLLRAVREVGGHIPVLGVNVGGRGILSEVKPENIAKAAERLAAEDYTIESRMRIDSSTKESTFPPALNEVYLIRLSHVKTPTYTVSIGGEVCLKQRMDGLMITTPTGSTGHSLSLGGPVVNGVEAFILMPVASINRVPPVVVPPEPIEVASNQDVVAIVDGQEEEVVKAGEKVTVKRHDVNAHFIRLHSKPLRQLHNLGFT